MSQLLGTPEDRWPLRRAVDALGASAQEAGPPSSVWLAGILYPSIATSINALVLFNEVLAGVGLRIWRGSYDPVRVIAGVDLMILLLAPVTFRLIVGLAAQKGPAAHRRRLHLGDAWRAGRGLAGSALGLVLCLQLLVGLAVLFLVGPVLVLSNLFRVDALPGPFLVLLLPVAALLLLYATCLQVLGQLALHSLACNRRGAGSALTHAWRLVRHSPWPTVRAGLVDLLLTAVVGVSIATVGVVIPAARVEPLILGVLLFYLLAKGFEGLARAGFWGTGLQRIWRAGGGRRRARAQRQGAR